MYVIVLNASAQRDFGLLKWWSIAGTTLASTPIVHSDTPLDTEWCGTGDAASSIALADVVQLAYRQFARVVHDDLLDPLLKLILCCYPNALSTLTADLRPSGPVVYSNFETCRLLSVVAALLISYIS